MGMIRPLSPILIGREFLTHSPPDLPPRHRILALLGTTDIEDQASPDEDGWFVSDFYLFHYLLAPVFPRRECARVLLSFVLC
jgi:hypothetical protein